MSQPASPSSPPPSSRPADAAPPARQWLTRAVILLSLLGNGIAAGYVMASRPDHPRPGHREFGDDFPPPPPPPPHERDGKDFRPPPPPRMNEPFRPVEGRNGGMVPRFIAPMLDELNERDAALLEEAFRHREAAMTPLRRALLERAADTTRSMLAADVSPENFRRDFLALREARLKYTSEIDEALLEALPRMSDEGRHLIAERFPK